MGNIITNASGGKSYHNYGLAIDFAILIDKDRNGTYDELGWSMVTDFNKNGTFDWQEVVKAFEDLGFEWGGRWRTFVDNPHCQKTYSYTWKELSEMYLAKNFIKDCLYVNVNDV
jgi:peptidoglycan L-alanyl-D-glutamate endopeptidase CwlK